MYVYKGNTVNAYVAIFQKHKVPWLKIITAMPVWAIVVSNLCGDMGFYVFETSMPSYLSEVLKFDVKTVSELNAVVMYGHICTISQSIVPRQPKRGYLKLQYVCLSIQHFFRPTTR